MREVKQAERLAVLECLGVVARTVAHKNCGASAPAVGATASGMCGPHQLDLDLQAPSRQPSALPLV